MATVGQCKALKMRSPPEGCRPRSLRAAQKRKRPATAPSSRTFETEQPPRRASCRSCQVSCCCGYQQILPVDGRPGMFGGQTSRPVLPRARGFDIISCQPAPNSIKRTPNFGSLRPVGRPWLGWTVGPGLRGMGPNHPGLIRHRAGYSGYWPVFRSSELSSNTSSCIESRIGNYEALLELASARREKSC